MKFFKFVIFFTLSSLTLFGQKVLSLEDCIRLSFENNLGIKVAQGNAQKGRNNFTIGNAGYLPTIVANADAGISNNNILLEFAGPNPPLERNNAEASNLGATLGFNYVLFNGLRVLRNYKLLGTLAGLGESESKQQIERIIIQTISAYINVVNATEIKNISKEALEISKERYERVKARIDFGGVNSLELLNAEVDLNADSSAYRSAIVNEQKAKRALLYILALPLETDFTTKQEHFSEKQLSLDELIKNAMDNNVAIESAYYNSNAAKIDLQLAKAGRSPILAMNAFAAHTEAYSEASFVAKNLNDAYGVNFTFSFNIFDGGRQNIKVKNAKIDYENSKWQIEDIKLQVEQDLRNAFDDYLLAVENLNFEKRNIAAAERNLERSKEVYNLGGINSTQLREAQLNLVSAKFRLLSAETSAILLEYQLRQLSGNLIAKEYF